MGRNKADPIKAKSTPAIRFYHRGQIRTIEEGEDRLLIGDQHRA